MRNVSDWLDASDYMEIKVDDLEIDKREWGDLPGVNRGLSVRFCLTPVAVDTFSLQVRSLNNIFECWILLMNIRKVTCLLSVLLRSLWPGCLEAVSGGEENQLELD